MTDKLANDPVEILDNTDDLLGEQETVVTETTADLDGLKNDLSGLSTHAEVQSEAMAEQYYQLGNTQVDSGNLEAISDAINEENTLTHTNITILGGADQLFMSESKGQQVLDDEIAKLTSLKAGFSGDNATMIDRLIAELTDSNKHSDLANRHPRTDGRDNMGNAKLVAARIASGYAEVLTTIQSKIAETGADTTVSYTIDRDKCIIGSSGNQLSDRKIHVDISLDFVEKTDVEKTDVEKTDVEKTDVEKTDVEKTDVEKTDVEKTDVEKTDVEKTDVEKTDVEKTDVEKTDVEKTDVEKTDVEKTDVEKTDVEKTDISPENMPEALEKFVTLMKKRVSDVMRFDNIPWRVVQGSSTHQQYYTFDADAWIPLDGNKQAVSIYAYNPETQTHDAVVLQVGVTAQGMPYIGLGDDMYYTPDSFDKKAIDDFFYEKTSGTDPKDYGPLPAMVRTALPHFSSEYIDHNDQPADVSETIPPITIDTTLVKETLIAYGLGSKKPAVEKPKPVAKKSETIIETSQLYTLDVDNSLLIDSLALGVTVDILKNTLSKVNDLSLRKELEKYLVLGKSKEAMKLVGMYEESLFPENKIPYNGKITADILKNFEKPNRYLWDYAKILDPKNTQQLSNEFYNTGPLPLSVKNAYLGFVWNDLMKLGETESSLQQKFGDWIKKPEKLMDTAGKPYAVLSKEDAQIYLFSKDHKLISKKSVLLGADSHIDAFGMRNGRMEALIAGQWHPIKNPDGSINAILNLYSNKSIQSTVAGLFEAHFFKQNTPAGLSYAMEITPPLVLDDKGQVVLDENGNPVKDEWWYPEQAFVWQRTPDGGWARGSKGINISFHETYKPAESIRAPLYKSENVRDKMISNGCVNISTPHLSELWDHFTVGSKVFITNYKTSSVVS